MAGSDTEIVVQLTAETAQLQSGMAEGAASVAQATDAMRASVASATAQYAAFDAIQKGSIQTSEDLAAAQATLSAVQETGAFTSEELAAKQAIVSAAMNKVGVEAEATAGMIGKITSNSRTMYSVSALVSDAMTGQFSRMRREVAAVGNETGVLGSALTFLLTPAGLVAAAMAAIAVAAVSAKDAIDALATAAAAGGGMAGMSKDQLEEMAQGFKDAGYSVHTARSAIEALASSGHVASDSMQTATQASLDLAQLTGKNADKIAEQLSHLGSSGLNGILKMDEQYHFLNDSQRDHIAQLFQEGQATEGVKSAFDALAQGAHRSVVTLKAEQGDAEGFWARMGTHIANAYDTISKGAHMGLTSQEELAQLEKTIAYAQRIGEGESYINGLLAHRTELMAKISKEAKEAQDAGAAARHGADQDQAMLHKHVGTGGSGELEKKLRDEEATQKVSYDHRAQFEMEYWGEILQTAKSGSAEYTVAWTKTQELQKQLDEHQLAEWKKNQSEMAAAARKAATEAAAAHRKASEEAMINLEIQRAGTEANTAERIQADAAILASATKLYGAMSPQQKAALDQMLSDGKAYDESVRALNIEKITAARDESLGEIANKRSQYQLQYSEGEISAKQLLQLEEQLAEQKLEIEKKYYADKERLDAGDPIAFAKDESAIVKAQQTAHAAMTAAEKEYHKNSEKEWQGYAKKIEGAMQGAINGMLFQHQTLRQGVANVALVMGEEFIQQAVMKPLDRWIDGEATKVSTALSTSTSLQAQRVANSAAEAASSAASVARATGVAGAQGIASFAGAPWPIDMGAPAFGASMAAAAASYSGFSAAGGWERVPIDGAMTELHKDEMVLPAHVANPIRDMAKNGGGQGGAHGGGMVVNLNTTDPRSWSDQLRRDPKALVNALKLAQRRGHFGGR